MPIKQVDALQDRDRAAWRTIYEPNMPEPIWHSLPFISDLAAHFTKSGGHKILDAACGDGGQMVGLTDEFLVVGLDQSPEAIDSAQNHLSRRGRRNFVLCEGRIESAPFPDAAFDGILFIDALSCFLQPSALLAEFHRVLRPDGILIITTFARTDPIAPLLNYIRDFVGIFEGKFINVLYDEETLRSLVSASGFQVISITERRDREAPHPHFREEWHEHDRLVLVAKRT